MSLRELVRRTWRKSVDNDIVNRAAAVAFYAMLALVPFLAVLLALAVGLLPDLTGSSGRRGMGNLTVQQFDATLREAFPPDVYEIVTEQIAWLQQNPPVGLLSIGLALSLVLASSLFVALGETLNVICGVREYRPFWRLRLVAAGMTLLQAAILLSALVVMVVWPLVPGWLGLGTVTTCLATAVQWLVVWGTLVLSFELALFVAPAARRRWRWVSVGSVLGSLVLMAATWLFGLYVRHFNSYDRTYGSLGGVMALLVWFWVCGLVLLFAAQVNQVIEEARQDREREGKFLKDRNEPAP
jgi:membrane protein